MWGYHVVHPSGLPLGKRLSTPPNVCCDERIFQVPFDAGTVNACVADPRPSLSPFLSRGFVVVVAFVEQAIPEAQPLTIPRGFRWWVPDYVPPDTLIVRKTVFVLVSGTVDGRMSLWDWDPVNLVVRVQCHDN